MSFAAPALLLAVLAGPLAFAAHHALRRRRRRYAVRFPAAGTLATLVDPTPAWRRHVPAALFALALAVLAVALARPQTTIAVAVEQASVVLVTDVSGSMAATDVEPSRLAAVQEAAQRFLDRVPSDLQVGAVAFSSFPHLTEPPTRDHDVIRALIGDLVAEGATATAEGLGAAIDMIGREGDERPPAAIILLSDGKHTTGTDPVRVAREAGRLEIPIYTVALGTPGGTVRAGPFGERIPVPPDPATMRRISRVSGGEAFAAADADQLDAVYERLGSRVGTRPEKREVSAAFAAGGILLLLGALAGSLRSFGRLP